MKCRYLLQTIRKKCHHILWKKKRKKYDRNVLRIIFHVKNKKHYDSNRLQIIFDISFKLSLWWQFEWNTKSLFLWKIRKNIINTKVYNVNGTGYMGHMIHTSTSVSISAVNTGTNNSVTGHLRARNPAQWQFQRGLEGSFETPNRTP